MKSFLYVCGVFGLLLVGPGCGSDGGGPSGPGSNSGGNPVAAGFGDLAVAYDQVVAANAAVYASAGFFAPAIIGTLVPTPEARMNGANEGGGVSCVPAGAQDVVFRYDTTLGDYVATAETGAPPGGARWVLYQLDINGAPVVPLVETGFFDVACGASPDTLDLCIETPSGITVVEVTLYWFFVSFPDYIITSSPTALYDPTGTTELELWFSAEGTVNQSIKTRLTVPLDDGVEVHAGLDDANLDPSGAPAPPYFSFGVGATKTSLQSTLLLNASASMSVASNGTILNILQGPYAPIEQEDRVESTSGVLACLSGNYLTPSVESATANCATGVIDTPIELSQTELDAMSDGYEALVDLLESMSVMLGVGIAAVMN